MSFEREVELAFVEKRRAEGVVSGGKVVGNVAGRTVIVLDDLCATGETLIRAATILREAGAAAVHVAFTHAPLPSGLEAIGAADCITQIVHTDSVGSALRMEGSPSASWSSVLSIAPLFGEAVARMLAGTTLVPLLQHWPPADRGDHGP